jgi:hypothetical protein
MSPVNHVAPSVESDSEATAELPVLDVAAYEASLEDTISRTDSIPTLRPAAEVDTSISATHEMPMLPKASAKKVARKPEVHKPDLYKLDVHETPVPVAREMLPAVSAPELEELRNALGKAERRIEELTARARIADTERAMSRAKRSRPPGCAARRSNAILPTPARASRAAIRRSRCSRPT